MQIMKCQPRQSPATPLPATAAADDGEDDDPSDDFGELNLDDLFGFGQQEGDQEEQDDNGDEQEEQDDDGDEQEKQDDKEDDEQEDEQHSRHVPLQPERKKRKTNKHAQASPQHSSSRTWWSPCLFLVARGSHVDELLQSLHALDFGARPQLFEVSIGSLDAEAFGVCQ